MFRTLFGFGVHHVAAVASCMLHLQERGWHDWGKGWDKGGGHGLSCSYRGQFLYCIPGIGCLTFLRLGWGGSWDRSKGSWQGQFGLCRGSHCPLEPSRL